MDLKKLNKCAYFFVTNNHFFFYKFTTSLSNVYANIYSTYSTRTSLYCKLSCTLQEYIILYPGFLFSIL
jgi:hypothetical protein